MAGDLESLQRARDAYERSLDEVESARAALNREIRKAALRGMPLRQIAEAVGLSHQRIHQIVGDEQERPRRRGGARAAGTAVVVALAAVLSVLVVPRDGRAESPAVIRCALASSGPHEGEWVVADVTVPPGADHVGTQFEVAFRIHPDHGPRTPVGLLPTGQPIPGRGDPRPCDLADDVRQFVESRYGVRDAPVCLEALRACQRERVERLYDGLGSQR